MNELEEFEFRHRLEQEQGSSGPQWSDLPHNAMEGLKEAPQTIAGIAAMGKAGMDLTDPIALAKSGANALAGTPIGETDAGKAVGMVKEGLDHTVDTIKNLPGQISEFAQHPLESTKEHIIEHPISSAVDAASIVLPALKASGAAETLGKYAGRMGENQMGKLHGTSQAQFKQLGRERFGDAMRSSFEHGDADLTRGSIGREEAIDNRIKQYGEDIGRLRAKADQTGSKMTPQEMADTIKKQLAPDYAPGGKHFDEQAGFERNIENIAHMPEGGIQNFADRASDIKRTAAQNKLRLPVNAETDIANRMSHINDAELGKRLPAELVEDYEKAKDEFGFAKSLKPLEARGEAKEALGAGANTITGMLKNAVHSVVPVEKLGAKAGFGAESAFKNIAKNGGAYAVGGVTAHLINTLSTDPQSLGKYAQPLLKAAQEGGNQAVAAMHYLLSTQYPEYNNLTQPK